jgi:integrase
MARSRRGRGEGSIYQRADNQWCATVSVGYDSQGRRKRRTLFGATKAEVQEKLAEVQMTLLEGTFIEPSKLRVGDYLDRWLEDAAKPSIRSTTHASYAGIIKNHIKPKIGGVLLSSLTPIHVQAMQSSLARDGASPRVRQLVHAVHSGALKQAVKWDLVVRNVCNAVDPPRVPKKEIEVLSQADVTKLLTAAKVNRFEAMFVLALGTGMRLGEIFALKWESVDLDRAALAVKHTLVEVNGQLTLAEPKTAKSRRRIDLPARVVSALRRHRKAQIKEGFPDVPWVFCNSVGGPLRRSHFHANVFKPILEAAELEPIRFHDLRHTSATLLLSAGVHPKVVQERLGHAQISITLDTYSHVMPSLQVEAAEKLDAALKG